MAFPVARTVSTSVTTATARVPSGSLLQPWLATPAMQPLWLPQGLPMDQAKLVAAAGALGPQDPVGQMPANRAYDDHPCVGPATQQWLAVYSLAGNPNPSPDFNVNWLFWPTDDSIPSDLPPTPSGVDEDGVLFFMAEEWDNSFGSFIRYWTVAWTPSSGFTFYGWISHDWTWFLDATQPYNFPGPTFGFGYEYEPMFDTAFPTATGGAETLFQTWFTPSSTYVAPPPTILSMSDPGDAMPTGIGPTYLGTVGPPPWLGTREWDQPVVRKSNGNYVVFGDTTYTSGSAPFTWTISEYTPDGVFVSTSTTDLVRTGYLNQASGGVVWGLPGSATVFLGTQPSDGPAAFTSYNYDTGVFGSPWILNASGGYAVPPFNLFQSWQIAADRLLLVSAGYPTPQGEIQFNYFNSDGTTGTFGTTAYDTTNSGRYWGSAPCPDGQHVWVVIGTDVGYPNWESHFFLVDLNNVPASLTTPDFVIDGFGYSLSGDTWGQQILSTLFPGRSQTSARYHYMWMYPIPARVKGSPRQTRVQDAPTPTGAPGSSWQNATVLSGNQGFSSESLAGVTAAHSQGTYFRIDAPTKWYRFDPQGQRGILMWWLSVTAQSSGLWTISPSHPFSSATLAGYMTSDGNSLVVEAGTSAARLDLAISQDAGTSWTLAPGHYYESSSGFDWAYPLILEPPLVSQTTLLVGSTVGQVAYSTDMGVTWGANLLPYWDQGFQVLQGIANTGEIIWAWGYRVYSGSLVYASLYWTTITSLLAGGGWAQTTFRQFSSANTSGSQVNYVSTLGSSLLMEGVEYNPFVDIWHLVYSANADQGGTTVYQEITPPSELIFNDGTGGLVYNINSVKLIPSPITTANPRMLLLGIANNQTDNADYFYSDDLGVTWNRSSVHFSSGLQSAQGVVGQGNLLVVPTQTGIAYSSDQGASWFIASSQPFNIAAPTWTPPSEAAVTPGRIVVVDEITSPVPFAYLDVGGSGPRGAGLSLLGSSAVRSRTMKATTSPSAVITGTAVPVR